MDKNRWERLQQIIDLAADLPTEQAVAAIKGACPDEKTLGAEALSLLKSGKEAGQFLEAPLMHVFSLGEESDLANTDCQSKSRYRIQCKLGEGGMGEVFLAKQELPVMRDVALKVMRPDVFSINQRARFALEHQVLAGLNHPGIAKIFDVGTTEDGRPFFAMEYIQGQPLHHYCEDHALDLAERLRLFVEICEAVAHAHRRDIVHRDLKPNNILVLQQSGKPRAKIIDFGIAKNLGDTIQSDGLQTTIGTVLGTPVFMAPEQADRNFGVIDHRTDVYALGCILYQLLCGKTPFDPSQLMILSLPEVVTFLREEEPLPPSTRLDEEGSMHSSERTSSETRDWQRRLRGDLDWIVSRAMEKDAARRYHSVTDLMNDVRKYLNGEPVDARPPSRRYRMKKFVNRHRALVTATTTVFTFLIGALIISLYAYFEVEQTNREIEEKNNDLRRKDIENSQIIAALENLMETIKPNREGAEVDVSVWLDQANEIVAKISDANAKSKARIHLILGEIFLSFGRYTEAEDHLCESLVFHRLAFGSNDRKSLEAWWRWCEFLKEIEQYQHAEQDVVQLLDAMRGNLRREDILQFQAGYTYAAILRKTSQQEASLQKFSKTLMAHRAAGITHKNDSFGIALRGFGNVCVDLNDFDSAEAAFNESKAVLLEFYGDEKNAEILETEYSMAWLAETKLDHDGAYANYCRIYHEAKERFGKNSKLAIACLLRLSGLKDGVQATEDMERAIQAASTSTVIREKRMRWLRAIHAYNLKGVGQLAFLEDFWLHLLEYQSLLTMDDLTIANNFADLLRTEGFLNDAEQVQRAVLDLYLDNFGEEGQEVSVLFCTMGEIYLGLGKVERAATQLKRAIALVRNRQHRYKFLYYGIYVDTLMKQRKLKDSVDVLKDAVMVACEEGAVEFFDLSHRLESYRQELYE